METFHLCTVQNIAYSFLNTLSKSKYNKTKSVLFVLKQWFATLPFPPPPPPPAENSPEPDTIIVPLLQQSLVELTVKDTLAIRKMCFHVQISFI